MSTTQPPEPPTKGPATPPVTEPAKPSARRGPYAKTKARRESIVRAAHAVFAAHGYRGGSLQEVADRVGMSQSSLLHHFPTKGDLLLAVLHLRDATGADGAASTGAEGYSAADAADFDGTIFGEAETGRDDALGEPEAYLLAAVERQARFNESVPGVIELYTVLCAESLTEDHPGRDYFTERYERLRNGYLGTFAALADEGRLRSGVDPARAAATLIALWDGIQTQWLMAPDQVDMAACLGDYLQLVVLPE